MTPRTYVHPRRKPGVPCEHSVAVLTSPWWEWSCIHCTPAFWRTFTEPDFRAEEKRPKAVECPLCLATVRYREGRIRRHWEDRGEDCRCSGLSEQVAHRYVDALIAGKGLATFAGASLKRRNITLERQEPEKPPATIIDQLRAARRQADWTQGYVAAQLHLACTTVTEWESGKNNPLIASVIRWADLLGLQLNVFGEGHRQIVASQAIIAWWLSELRGTSLNKLSKKIGADPRSLSRWESGRATFRLADLEDWADALGLAVELRRKGEA